MTEDIVEFGAPTPRPKRVRRRGRPPWLENRMLPVAGLGALAGAASLAAPWQKMVFNPQQGDSRPLAGESDQALLISLGAYGSGYLLTLIATVAAVALVFYGHQRVSVTARVIGTALSGANLVLLAMMAYVLTKGTAVNVGFIIVYPEDRARMSINLDWGFYAAVAAVVALGVAALRAQPVAPRIGGEEPGSEGESGAPGRAEDGEPDDGVIDLSVSVHPVGKQVAAG
jgi:hypothetical protein